MNRWPRPGGASGSGSHVRAAELAAARMDGPLATVDETWLTEHLQACADCREIAADYEAQRAALRALRAASPEPPRDLWARTSAAIDAGARPRPRVAVGALPLAPAAGLLVLAIAVASVLNGTSPLTPGTPAAAEATPITLPAGVLQVISRGEDGSVEILSRHLDQVCPMGTTSCGLSDSLDVTQSAQLEGNARLAAIISPTEDHLVVIERGDGPQRVYVLAVPHPDTETPPPDTSTPRVTHGASEPPSASATPKSAVTTAPTSGPSDGPTSTTEPSTPPEASPTPDTESPSTEPTASPPPDGSESPTPAPSVAVSPGPDGAVEIASDVTLVGSAAGYSGDGTAFAFSARPADGSAGPDVFVWHTGDARAVAVTTDHMSVFDGWLGDRLLVSRVVDGDPVTLVLDPDTGAERAVDGTSMWRPTVSPDGSVAAWWQGSIKLDADGQTWVPDKGQLVLGQWPADGTDPQLLADGPIGDWEVMWDRDASVIAVWVSGQGPDEVGRLSLYPIDPKTGLADLKHPALEDAPAYDNISLRPGRLAWSAPDSAGDTQVDVLAWQGDTFGHLQLTTIKGASVVR
jgi:hypothetical protein